MTLLEIIHEAKRTGDLTPLMNAIPYSRFLGLTADIQDGEHVGKLTYHESLIGNPALPAIHGGTIGALLESTAIVELFWRTETIVLPKIITVTVDYLRSAGPRDTYAKAVITRQGRRVATVHATAWQDDRQKPVAAAIVHLLLKSADSA
jgi:acyl-coenzyme A thioesterase PaaI-like protein